VVTFASALVVLDILKIARFVAKRSKPNARFLCNQLQCFFVSTVKQAICSTCQGAKIVALLAQF
jgi:hypothetical protein